MEQELKLKQAIDAFKVQPSRKSSTLSTSLQSFSRKISIAVALIGCAVILGWIFDLPVLKGILPELATMKVSTAIGFILGGLSLWLLHKQRQVHKSIGKQKKTPLSFIFSWRRLAQACAILVLIIGLATLIQYGFNLNLGINQLLLKNKQTLDITTLSSMEPNSALNFLLLGTSLLLLSLRRRHYSSIQFFALLGFLISFMGLLGYLYGNPYFYRVGSSTAMALHTATTFLLLSLGILFARPERGLMAVVTSDSAGGVLAQRLLPAALVVPPVMCWLLSLGYHWQIYTAEIEVSLLSILTVVIFVVLIWWNARSLDASANRHRDSETTLKQTKQELEQRVRQGTTQLRQANKQLQNEISEHQQVEQALRLALDAAEMGTWDWNLVTNQITLSERHEQLFGLAPGSFDGTYETLVACLHPEDRDRITEAISLARDERMSYEQEFRVVWSDESIHWIQGKGQFFDDETGMASRMVGTVRDITTRKQAEETPQNTKDELEFTIAQPTEELSHANPQQEFEVLEAGKQAEKALRESQRRFHAIFDDKFQFTGLLELNGTVLEINQTALDFGGLKRSDVMGRPLWETRWWTISTESQERLQEAIAQAANGQFVHYEVEVLGARETVATLDLSLKPMRDETGKVILVILQGRDLTDYKQTEKALQQAKEKLTNSVNELEQRNREIALLAEMSELLQACLTVEEAYKMLAQLVQPLFPEVSGGVFVINDSKNLVDAVATWGESALMSEKRFTPDECWAMRRGRSHFVESLHSNLRCKHVQADSSNAESLCVPMMLQGEALGVLYLTSPQKGRLTEAKQQLSVTIAEHLALALANFKLQEGLQNKPS